MIPTQFRIFKAGLNDSTKGAILFDAKAAAMLMAAYDKHGTDLMLDLEHLSLDSKSPNFDPNARGWFNLEVRNGELWAVNVRWTPEGIRRLTTKTQRYISPAFLRDKNGRPTFMLNAALCAMPATDKPMALVAASGRPVTGLLALSTLEGNTMDLTAIAAALGLPPEATQDEIVAAIKALLEGEVKPPAVAATEAGDGGATAAPPVGPAAPAGPAARKTTVSIQHTQDTSSAAVLELSQKVATLEAAALADKRTALIKANASKLTPVLEAWAQTQSIATLSTFFAAAGPQEQVDTEATRVVTASQTQGAETVMTLTQAELDVCKDTNTDPKAVLAYKQKEAANRGSK